jgi:hypothetical protein
VSINLLFLALVFKGPVAQAVLQVQGAMQHHQQRKKGLQVQEENKVVMKLHQLVVSLLWTWTQCDNQLLQHIGRCQQLRVEVGRMLGNHQAWLVLDLLIWDCRRLLWRKDRVAMA